jgi:hypothetical protein
MAVHINLSRWFLISLSHWNQTILNWLDRNNWRWNQFVRLLPDTEYVAGSSEMDSCSFKCPSCIQLPAVFSQSCGRHERGKTWAVYVYAFLTSLASCIDNAWCLQKKIVSHCSLLSFLCLHWFPVYSDARFWMTFSSQVSSWISCPIWTLVATCAFSFCSESLDVGYIVNRVTWFTFNANCLLWFIIWTLNNSVTRLCTTRRVFVWRDLGTVVCWNTARETRKLLLVMWRDVILSYVQEVRGDWCFFFQPGSKWRHACIGFIAMAYAVLRDVTRT